MTKELSDLAWRCLPKEFKEEVKKLYIETEIELSKKKGASDNLTQQLRGMNRQLAYLFGYHNLTSDAEGEEMLMCEKSKVQNYKRTIDEFLPKAFSNYDKGFWTGQKAAVDELFGSKFLPDEEPKPAEPKFKVGDMVRIKGDGYEPNLHKGDVGEVLDINDKEQCFVLFKKSQAWIYTDCLEPYTEPKEKNHIAQDLEMVDNIIKDGFSKERRLNIAAMAMQGLLSNTALYEHKVKEWLRCESNDNPIKFIPMLALKYADSLIAEAKKGGSK